MLKSNPLMTFDDNTKGEVISCFKIGLLELDLIGIVIREDGVEITGRIINPGFGEMGKFIYKTMSIFIVLLGILTFLGVELYFSYNGIKGVGIGVLIVIAGPFIAGMVVYQIARDNLIPLITKPKVLFFKKDQISGYKYVRDDAESLFVTFLINDASFPDGSFGFLLKEASNRRDDFRKILEGFKKIEHQQKG